MRELFVRFGDSMPLLQALRRCRCHIYRRQAQQFVEVLWRTCGLTQYFASAAAMSHMPLFAVWEERSRLSNEVITAQEMNNPQVQRMNLIKLGCAQDVAIYCLETAAKQAQSSQFNETLSWSEATAEANARDLQLEKCSPRSELGLKVFSWRAADLGQGDRDFWQQPFPGRCMADGGWLDGLSWLINMKFTQSIRSIRHAHDLTGILKIKMAGTWDAPSILCTQYIAVAFKYFRSVSFTVGVPTLWFWCVTYEGLPARLSCQLFLSLQQSVGQTAATFPRIQGTRGCI